MRHLRTLIAALLLLHTGQAQTIVKLYPGKAPGSEQWTWTSATFDGFPGNRMLYNVADPELLVYPAPKDKATGSAIIVAPGGAFHILSIDNEGTAVAKWLNDHGITVFVLKYRLVRSLTPNPMQELMPLMGDFRKLDSINAPVVDMARNDGIEAMKFVRTHAKDYGISPEKIGFMGFSAGGTVTMSVMLSAAPEWKPDFAAPIYLYNNAVLGNQMPSKPTPIFIAVASDDQLGFVPHSIRVYEKWHQAKQDAELHIYEKGGHGFGMARQNLSSDQWTSDFEHWLRIRGYIR